jgi:tRNA pseudouridine38-40 synthase
MALRVALLIEYDGTNYHGWQIQKNSNLSTIQQQLEMAISRVANHQVHTVCAGRTDRGVHAKGQILHFDTNSRRQEENWIFGINSHLPKDIRVLQAKEVDISFDARRSALYRTYSYIIYNSQVSPGLFRHNLSWVNGKLDVRLMQKAANVWIGEHDFTSFRGKDCQSKSPVRRVDQILCSRQKNLVIISITANAFLKHMVRNMIGVLIKIGQLGANDNQNDSLIILAKEILLAKNRRAAFATAPPEGLYLVSVGYPRRFNMFIS